MEYTFDPDRTYCLLMVSRISHLTSVPRKNIDQGIHLLDIIFLDKRVVLIVLKDNFSSKQSSEKTMGNKSNNFYMCCNKNFRMMLDWYW